LIKRTLLEKVVKEYNRFHGAEAQVKVLKQYTETKGHLITQFKGPFCFSCAPDEYYMDFQILLEEKTGLKFKVNSIRQGMDGAILDFEYDKNEQALVYLLHF